MLNLPESNFPYIAVSVDHHSIVFVHWSEISITSVVWRLFSPLNTLSLGNLYSVLKIGWYTLTELLYVPEFHTSTNQYILYPFIFFHFSTVYPCFAFRNYTDTSKFSFWALPGFFEYPIGLHQQPSLAASRWVSVAYSGCSQFVTLGEAQSVLLLFWTCSIVRKQIQCFGSWLCSFQVKITILLSPIEGAISNIECNAPSLEPSSLVQSFTNAHICSVLRSCWIENDTFSFSPVPSFFWWPEMGTTYRCLHSVALSVLPLALYMSSSVV
jgi:hypothetical protein